MSVGYQEFLAQKRRAVERDGIEVAADDLHRGDFQRSVPTLFDGGGAA